MRDNSWKAAGGGSSGRRQNKRPQREEQMSSTRRSVLFGVAALAAAPAAKAQTGSWPTRPLRIIIPTAPGGSPDMVSRTLGNKLTERFGQPVVVESITQG